MPATFHKDKNKWSWGKGPAIYDTKEEAEKAGIAIEISKKEKAKHKSIIQEMIDKLPKK